MTLMVLAVALCLPYRSTCALITWSGERFADTPKTQGNKDVQFFTVGNLRWKDVGHLYEEEGVRVSSNRQG
jgi:hypothetical protein